MKQATLCFLIKGNQICLGLKKRGFGAGRWNGFGGKVTESESVEAATVREVEEEIGVKVGELSKVAEFAFTFPHNSDWNQVVHTYFVRAWLGEPVEGEEMKPQWFLKSNLPFEKMWPDDVHWLPRVLLGEKLNGDFTFGEGDKVLNFRIEAVDGF